MHDILKWWLFWWKCFLMGFWGFNSAFSKIRTIVACVLAVFFFSRAFRDKVAKHEKLTVAISAYLCLFGAIYYSIFVAPFKLYQPEQEAHQSQIEAANLEKYRPKLQATLFIDEIRTNEDCVRYHIEISNSGEVTANMQHEVNVSGYHHRHGRVDAGNTLAFDTIEPHTGNHSISPATPWYWMTNDTTWTTELKLTYQFFIDGKEQWLRTTLYFRVDRDSIHLGSYSPYHSDPPVPKPDRAEEVAQEFLSLSDWADDYILQWTNMPAISASNAVREFYIDDKTNLVRFYFHPRGKSIRLTNEYVKGKDFTNKVGAIWNQGGAALIANEVIDEEPEDFWIQFTNNFGKNATNSRAP